MGRKKLVEVASHSDDAVKYNKSARIRELFDSGITEVKQIQSHLIADGQPTSLPTIYTTLGTYKKKLAGGASVVTDKKAPMSAPSVKTRAAVVGNGLIGQLEVIKGLVKDMGAEQVKRMVDLFA